MGSIDSPSFTPNVPEEKRRESFGNRIRLEPSGLLILDSGPSYYDNVLLRDTPKRRRIEDGLNDLIINLVKRVGRIRIRRRAEQAEQKRREEEERIRRQREEELRRQREELAERQREEQARVDELLGYADAWRQSKNIRGYLGAVCDMLLERDGAISTDGQTAEYLRWARDQVDRLDPLRPSPPSVLDVRRDVVASIDCPPRTSGSVIAKEKDDRLSFMS